MVSVISTAVSQWSSAAGLRCVPRDGARCRATIFGNAVATFPSYWLNRRWAWGKAGRSHVWQEVVPFWIMAALGIAFSIIGGVAGPGTSATTTTSITPHQTCWSTRANVISFAVFWVVKLVVFNRMFKVDTGGVRRAPRRREEAADEARCPPTGACPRRAGRSAVPSGGSVPEVVELQGDTEVLFLAGADDLLKVVALLAGDPQLVALGL